MMRAKTALASLSLLLALSLSGCGSDSALTDYTSQMNTFYDAFSSGTLALEQIDPSSETAQEELLSGLDELTALTGTLSARNETNPLHRHHATGQDAGR